MSEYEKRKLFLDATIAIAKEVKTDFYDITSIGETVGLAECLLKEIEKSIRPAKKAVASKGQ